MSDYKIVIDAGHGGDDPGASGNGIIEKNLNLQISQYMYNLFRELNIPVTLTRNGDVTLSPTERVQKILNAYGNSRNVIVISNHINAGGGDGAEVIYALRNNSNLSNLVLNNLEKAGQNVRKVYQRRLPSDTSKDYYFIHRDTGVTEPIIVEYGFLDTASDAEQLKNNYQKYAAAVVDAVLEYIGYSELTDKNTYTVKSGDTLWSIAKKYNLTVNELKELNNLNSNLLSIGQVLIVSEISEPTDNYITYVVKNGDTLYSIARNYNTTVNELITYNNLNSTALSIGQLLRIPTMQTIIEEELPTSEYITYTVKSGDNLYSIARNYNTTVSELMNYNNLKTNLLSIGQLLRIPINSQNNNTYTVKSGDNLYSIAKKYNTTVDEIKRKNNLTSNLLSIGQQLII